MTTLVIGARGSVGRHVLHGLRAAGEPVRASVRDLATAGDLPAGVPVVAADLTRPDTLKAALNGIDQVFAYAEGAPVFAAAARDAGIGHVVLLSSGSTLLPWAHDNAITREHREAEHALSAAGLRCTPIRPLVLAGNALAWQHSIRRDGVVRVTHPDHVTAPLHERDIAAVAVAALLDPSRPDLSGLLTGGELLSQRDQVAQIAAAAERPIRVEELTEAEAAEHFARFMPADQAEAILEFIRHESPRTTTVEQILGRPPVTFQQWADDHASSYR
jgi:uncharacterized protein YbjT (DUF2867 family)